MGQAEPANPLLPMKSPGIYDLIHLDTGAMYRALAWKLHRDADGAEKLERTRRRA